MIDSKELRIGNYILDYKEEIKIVDSIMFVGYNVSNYERKHDIWQPLDEAKPIPLTEQWLIDFGFEVEYYSLSKVMAYSKGNLTIAFSEGNLISVMFGIQRLGNKDLIKSVHQLQNLFHSINNEELKLNK